MEGLICGATHAPPPDHVADQAACVVSLRLVLASLQPSNHHLAQLTVRSLLDQQVPSCAGIGSSGV